MPSKSIYLWMGMILLLLGCNLEKTIDVQLPKQESQLVVECYLEHGKPYRLLLTETLGYFDNSLSAEINDASVYIYRNDQAIALHHTIRIDTSTRKIYNYIADELVDSTGGATYRLEITDTKGRRIEAETHFMPIVPISEVSWEFEKPRPGQSQDNRRALLLIRHPEDPTRENYYRLRILRDSAGVLERQLDFVYRGILASNGELTIGTSYRFRDGDTLHILLYHTDKNFYDYFRTISDARDANGNPFAPPPAIISGVKGGLGVFAALSYDHQMIIIKKDTLQQQP